MTTTLAQFAPDQTVDLTAIERVIVAGDLSKLSADERWDYYRGVCASVGLNPFTRPFDYIPLNGKLILYALKGATDQLRPIHGISIQKPDVQIVDGLCIVTVTATDKRGREDSDLGIVSIDGLRGEQRANAVMKAITKAKRRVTLSMCGLGMLDETEVETIPTARPLGLEPAHGVRIETAAVVVEGAAVDAVTPIRQWVTTFEQQWEMGCATAVGFGATIPPKPTASTYTKSICQAALKDLAGNIALRRESLALDQTLAEAGGSLPVADVSTLSDTDLDARLEAGTKRVMGRPRATDPAPLRTALVVELRRAIDDGRAAGLTFTIPDNLEGVSDADIEALTDDIRTAMLAGAPA